MRVVQTYWWNTFNNFGDALTPYVLRRFSGVEARRSTVARAEAVCIGSLLEHVPPEWDGHIVGTGKLFRDSPLSLYTNTARIWALRGPYSASGVPGNYAIGDPGLLADELVADFVRTRDIDLGIVPHWTDKALAKRQEWFNPRWSTIIIDPHDEPLQVVASILRCKKIVTSSLHGMIVADAGGIPRRLEYTSTLDKEGGQFKFEDYSASIHTPLEFGKVIEASRFHVQDRKHELYDSFKAFGRFLCSQ